MRNIRHGLTIACLAALWLTACGGGGGSGSSSSGGANSTPTASAGTAQTVDAGTAVTLNGSGADSDGTIASFSWTQTAGVTVSLSNAGSAQPSFTAPAVTSVSTLQFSLVVTDNRGASSAASTVTITVNPPNVAPVADAGSPQSATSGNMVTLNASASSDLDGHIAAYTWSQTAGTAVVLSGNDLAMPDFVAPAVTSATILTFAVVVTDNGGRSSAPATVTITVNPAAPGEVSVSGRIRYERPPFATSFPFGLDYGDPDLLPARGITVRLRDAATQAVLATCTTDINGNFSLTAPASTTVVIDAVAELLRSSGLPQWNVSVRDGVASPIYSHSSAAFSTDSGVTRNLDIPMNIDPSGVATGVRASGAFAALDTVYEGIQFILDASPLESFPVLVVDWGSQALGTFYQGGNPDRIALLSDLSADTDEFDEHVVAHEFGHYIEHNFSRSDSIGGPHGVGDSLDIRVAFGEGFGYAFAAMVLDDPDARDSFVDNGNHRSGGFNIEDNPPAPNDPTGCWCSESSVWSILYDIYDDDADSGDVLALGFQPIWNVLVGEQAATPAFTSIFTFIAAFKTEQPDHTAGIDTLLSAQNIVTDVDQFGTTETTLPDGLPSAAAFPLYTNVTFGAGPVTLRTVDDAGTSNKLGNRRYVVFENTVTRNVTITVSTSNTDTNADPDFVVWQAGQFVRAGTQPPPGPEVQTIMNMEPGIYVIDVYDCGNGCVPAEAASGDFDLTVTIN